jgi:hypothetical protein
MKDVLSVASINWPDAKEFGNIEFTILKKTSENLYKATCNSYLWLFQFQSFWIKSAEANLNVLYKGAHFL